MKYGVWWVVVVRMGRRCGRAVRMLDAGGLTYERRRSVLVLVPRGGVNASRAGGV